MMPFLAFIIGLALPTVNGWLILGLLQYRKRVLFRTEQWVMGCMLGLTFMSLLVFCAHAALGMRLVLFGFLSIQCIVLALLLGLHWYLKPNRSVVAPTYKTAPFSQPVKIFFMVLGAWIAIRTIILATTFLVLTPTYLDDSLDNWNLRAKVFFYDARLTLVMPGEDPAISPMGVSSYAPAVPLMKTWLSTLNGEWSDPLINSIHIVWYIGAVSLVYFALRRRMTMLWAFVGTYILESLPLFLMHGTNAYADAFVSVHIFLAVSMAFLGLTERDPLSRLSYLSIGAFAAGLLGGFTKNEGLLVYLPPLLLILIIGLAYLHREQRLTIADLKRIVLNYALWLIILILPWLTFKWMNGLTFGNAKPITGLGFAWQEGVLHAIVINTFFEGNWLLLFPLFFALLILRWRRAFSPLIVLTVFFLIVYIGQTLLFLFTGLSTEALRQTGYARGLIHLIPVIVLLTGLLLAPATSPMESHPTPGAAKD